jgi:hypothetical protein
VHRIKGTEAKSYISEQGSSDAGPVSSVSPVSAPQLPLEDPPPTSITTKKNSEWLVKPKKQTTHMNHTGKRQQTTQSNDPTDHHVMCSVLYQERGHERI